MEEEVRRVWLRFSTPVEEAYTTLRLVGAAGDTLAAPLRLLPDGGGRELVADLPRALAQGPWLALWRTVGADGHPIEGSFTFEVLPRPGAITSDPGAGAPVSPAAGDGGAAGADRGSGDRIGPPGDPGASGSPTPVATREGAFAADAPFPVALRFVWFTVILLLVGGAAFRGLVLPRARRAGLAGDAFAAGEARARRIVALLTGGAALLLPARLWVRSAALHGQERAWDPEPLLVLLGSTGWGLGWSLQLAATLALVLASAATTHPRWRSRGWWAVGGAALVLAAIPSASGHAAGARAAPLAMLADAAHVTAAGVWLGSLALVLGAGLPAAWRSRDRTGSAAALARAFSPVALTSAAVLSATGVASSLFHVSSFAELWRTVYGNTLTFKVGLVAVVALVGLYNWKRVLPRLGTPRGSAALRRSATLELAFAGLVLLVTAILVGLPTP